ncbi:MAG: PHP domain-containing protein [Deltaproteobacteria bacterium]|nr:PHP domain-containing protein [Deltaproteobacteria bacterium]
MSPRNIIQRSIDASLDLIAICDHNTSENAGAVMREGRRRDISVLPGLEICSKEEVHILAIFGELEQALAMQEWVYAGLSGQNQPEVFGYQIVANEDSEVLGENPRLLIGATRLGLGDIVRQTHALSGLSVSAHLDRPANGIINQLGFIPPDLELDAVEVSYRVPLAKARELIPVIGALPCITSSDAHFFQDIGRAATVFRMAAPTIAEIGLALRGEHNRGILT